MNVANSGALPATADEESDDDDALTGSFVTDARNQFSAALRSSLTNRYLCANIVYVIYACVILYIDFKLYPDYLEAYNSTAVYTIHGRSIASAASSSTDDSEPVNPEADAILARINRLYVASGFIHAFNALQYYWAWLPSGFRWHHRVMIPEYLNMIGAGMYLYTSFLYPQCNEYTSDVTMRVHRLETAAALLEVVAACGWAYTWWLTYPRRLGRGWTLDDPDFWAVVFIVVPSLVYIAYNFQIVRDPSLYGTDMLYTTGDILYACGAFCYLAAALRDDGWFWFMPSAGRLVYNADGKQPAAAQRTEYMPLISVGTSPRASDGKRGALSPSRPALQQEFSVFSIASSGELRV